MSTPSLPHPPSARLIARVSYVLAALGWGLAALVAAADWEAAGISAGFILGLSVGICFTITAAIAVVLPEAQRIYALGWLERGQYGRYAPAEQEPAPRHLTSVE